MTDTTSHPRTSAPDITAEATAERPDSAPAAELGGSTGIARFTLGIARIGLGWVFLWAFLDKTFGFGLQTSGDRAWLNGGSPTTGYLAGQNEAEGPFAGVLAAMSGQAWVDWLFMSGLGGVGIALVLGIGMRLAAVGAVCVMGSLWLSQLPLTQNPFMDQHLMYLLLAVALTAAKAGDTIGFGRPWSRSTLVRTLPILR